MVNGCEDLVRLIGPPDTTCSLYHVEINQRVGWELNYDIYRRTLVCFVEKFVFCVACSYSYAELRAPAVYEHHLYTSSSCIQAPAVHEFQLYTSTTCTRAPAVYEHQLYTSSSCIRAPPVHERHLYTSTSCTRVPAVYEHHLYTSASCIRAPAVHEFQLYTSTSCTRVPAVHEHQLYTGASCIRAPAGSETVHETLFCIQIPCLNFKGIGKVKIESWATCGPLFEYIQSIYTPKIW